MKKKYKDLLSKVFSILGEETSTRAVSVRLKALLDTQDYLNVREKAYIYKHFRNLSRVGDPEYYKFNTVILEATKVMNKVERNNTARAKKKIIKDTLKNNREQRLPVLFYLCSYHEKCAEDHKAYQGKLYVDRYWKSTLEQYPDLWWLVEPVQAYIRNHDLMTIQEATSSKPYLITRPNCKHFFIPIDIWTVLTSSLPAIKREHPESVQGTGNKSHRQYRKEYYKLRDRLRRNRDKEKD